MLNQTPATDNVFRVFRGNHTGGNLVAYRVPVTEGMTVLDGILYIQSRLDGTLACRWNCKAGRCGSCGAEVNGVPRLLCRTPVAAFGDEPIGVCPLQAFPVIKDLVSDVSENYRINTQIPPFTPWPDQSRPWTIYSQDVARGTQFRKCIECFLCQDVCHVVRQQKGLARYMGPRAMVRLAALEAHPKDVLSRTDLLRGPAGIAYCDISRHCQDVCPEQIAIVDAAIFPLKERLGNDYLEPWRALLRTFEEREMAQDG